MMRTRVKICGLSRESDIQTAVKAGADAIGLVFYEPSPRNVSIAQAAKLVKQVPAFVTTVGLFVNAQKAEVEEVIQHTGIDLLQFHGDESAGFCEQFDRPYIKALRVSDDTEITHFASLYSSATGLLLDTYQKGKPGGTGETFNWDLIPENLNLPVILAGGLKQDNVAQAIEKVRPYAVDVSGGVEMEKGIKDKDKIYAFMKEVQGVDRS
ncbi:MAG: phosphoribosylanthranilate isomerase [Gammaproteobacteria bacterium]|nr:phosphoribosylanthranilate isomerase [Gammaproteobacteria bacterium]